MYSTPKYEGDSFDRYWVFGISENSNQVQILPKDIGVTSGFSKKILLVRSRKTTKKKLVNM